MPLINNHSCPIKPTFSLRVFLDTILPLVFIICQQLSYKMKPTFLPSTQWTIANSCLVSTLLRNLPSPGLLPCCRPWLASRAASSSAVPLPFRKLPLSSNPINMHSSAVETTFLCFLNYCNFPTLLDIISDPRLGHNLKLEPNNQHLISVRSPVTGMLT